MSKTLTHGRSTEAVTGDHARRLQAVERNLSLEQARYGIPALRDRLFLAAGVQRGEQSRNFEPGFVNGTASIASGVTQYCACYWPGGVNTGMTFILTTIGVYTDASPNSGGAIYSYDGVTLTRQAVNQQKWDSTFAVGMNRLQWGIPVNLVEGVYYVAIRYFQSAVTTAPAWGTATAADSTVWGGDPNGDATPNNWPIIFRSTGATGQLPASVSSSTFGQGVIANLPYVGLY